VRRVTFVRVVLTGCMRSRRSVCRANDARPSRLSCNILLHPRRCRHPVEGQSSGRSNSGRQTRSQGPADCPRLFGKRRRAYHSVASGDRIGAARRQVKQSPARPTYAVARHMNVPQETDRTRVTSVHRNDTRRRRRLHRWDSRADRASGCSQRIGLDRPLSPDAIAQDSAVGGMTSRMKACADDAALQQQRGRGLRCRTAAAGPDVAGARRISCRRRQSFAAGASSSAARDRVGRGDSRFKLELPH